MKKGYTVILFYLFKKIVNTEEFKNEQRKLAKSFDVLGRILIAEEGINATLEGTDTNIKKYIKKFKAQRGFGKVVMKQSTGNGKAFTNLKIKIRPEIVTLGAGSFDIKKETAKEVTAKQLHTMYEKNEDFVVLDLRDDYEIKVGYFENTVNPELQNFRDLPAKISQLSELKTKKVVAVCTGGIRCEKATCLLQREGFQNIYQLKDGIHTYMQEYPAQHFKGSLFVFDNRLTTPVVETPDREIVGKCNYCNALSEDFYSDDSIRPSRKILCCSTCLPSQPHLRKCS